MYTFSDMMGEHFYQAEKKKLIFTGPIQICLTFYSDESHSIIAETVGVRRPLRLGPVWLQLVDCQLVMEEYRNCVVETLSPVTVHSTLMTGDGQQKDLFLQSDRKRFFRNA